LRTRLLCVAMLVALVAGCRDREGRTGEGAAEGAPVIVISIDTLRADHLPAYGYKEIRTPHIDALRADSILFENAYTHVPLTLPSHVAMLTGTLPPENGVRNNIGFRFDAAKHETIPALLKKKGYATGAAISAYVLRGTTGLRAAFDDYDDNIAVREGAAVGSLQRDGRETAAIAKRWIDGHRGKPFFYMLHLFEPHSPYEPSYDGEIVKTDAIVGDFLAHLKTAGIYDDAVIVLMSDHGEGLGDHGEDEHGIFLYREAIRIPLLLKLPAKQRANTSVARAAQLIDVLPTVASVTGAELPAAARGTSLLAEKAEPRHIYSETVYPRIHLGWSDLRSLTDERFHYIEGPSPELYDVASDPAERTNVLKDQRRTFAAMRTALEAIPRGSLAPSSVDPEEAKKLAALGYLSGGSSDAGGPLPDPKERIGDLVAMRQAGELVKQKRYAPAIARLREVVAASPRFTDAWTLLGQALSESGAVEEAITAYRRVVELAPSLSPEIGLSLAGLYLGSNRFDEAAAHARLGEAINPGGANLLLGRVALRQRKPEVALRHANLAGAQPAHRLQAAVLAAQALASQGPQSFAHALAGLDQVKQQAKAPVPMLELARGDILARMNRLDEAERAFLEEIRHFPNQREAYSSLTIVYWIRGDEARARRTMESLVRVSPSADSRRFAAGVFRELGATRLEREFSR
jgi:choline-sulfatase